MNESFAYVPASHVLRAIENWRAAPETKTGAQLSRVDQLQSLARCCEDDQNIILSASDAHLLGRHLRFGSDS